MSSLAFSNTSLVFVSSSNNELLLWNPKEQLKSTESSVSDVAQPDKILDLASSDAVTDITIKEVSTDSFMVTATTDSSVSVFYVKSSGKQSAQKGNKVIKKESTVKVNGQSDQAIHTSIVNESSVNIIHGSTFQLRRSHVKLIDDAGKVQKEITLGSEIQTESKVQGRNGAGKRDDQYQVVGIEDEGNARVNNGLR